jgi:hypothetical protein
MCAETAPSRLNQPKKEVIMSRKLDNIDKTFAIVAHNPVSAITSATLRTLTNPFRAQRQSFSTYYAKNREYSLKHQQISITIKECNNCDAKNHGILSKWHKQGDIRSHATQFAMGENKPATYYGKDTFCAEHKDDAFAAQGNYRRARDY